MGWIDQYAAAARAEGVQEERERLKPYELWADEAHTVFCRLLSHLNQGEWVPQGRVWKVVDKIKDMMFSCPDDIGAVRSLTEAPNGTGVKAEAGEGRG